MKMDDMVLVSVDDHLIEPRDLFLRHMPEKLRDRAPRIIEKNGRELWQFEDVVQPTIGLNAVAGRPRNEYGMEPISYDDMRRGCFDVDARVDDMNANGVLGCLCFPTFPSFDGGLFLRVKDKALALAAVQAYNDWHVHEWAGAHPGRFIPLALIPLWDVDRAVEEVERVAKLGVHAISFPDNPAVKGLPSIHTDHWDPLWKVCADNAVVICSHIGTGAQPPHASAESPIDSWITSMPISISFSAADWVHAPMWKKYPSLRLALSEGGIGWVPYFLERADFTHQHHHAWTNADFGGEKPSDVFKRHVITCFIDDVFGLRNLPEMNPDMVTWECDYPHSDTTWPESPEYLWRSLEGLPDEIIHGVTHRNAMREFHYDPLRLLGEASCTVGALRAKAKDVDTRPVSLGGLKPSDMEGRPVTSADIQRMMSSAL